jgi:hypothetical protein
MLQKQHRPGAPSGAHGARPELSLAAGSGSINTSSDPLAQDARRAADTRNLPLVTENVADLRFRRDVSKLYRLGARVLFELLVELGAKHMIRTSIEEEVARFADIDTVQLRLLGGGQFPPAPLRLASRSGPRRSRR